MSEHYTKLDCVAEGKLQYSKDSGYYCYVCGDSYSKADLKRETEPPGRDRTVRIGVRLRAAAKAGTLAAERAAIAAELSRNSLLLSSTIPFLPFLAMALLALATALRLWWVKESPVQILPGPRAKRLRGLDRVRYWIACRLLTLGVRLGRRGGVVWPVFQWVAPLSAKGGSNYIVSIAAATAVLGYNLLSNQFWTTAGFLRAVRGLALLGSAAAGDTEVHVSVGEVVKAILINRTTGFPNMDDLLPVSITVPPGSPIAAIVRDAATTNAINLMVDIIP